jgi:hypothetical protein
MEELTTGRVQLAYAVTNTEEVDFRSAGRFALESGALARMIRSCTRSAAATLLKPVLITNRLGVGPQRR